MKAFKITLLLLVALSIPVLLAAQTGPLAQPQSLAGTWSNSEFGYQMTLILQTDGTGEFDGEQIRYDARNNQLVITQAGRATAYNFTLTGSTLNLSGGDIEGSLAFARSGGAGPTAPVEEVVTSPGNSATGGDVTGKWAGSGETIEFTPQGKCFYLNQTFDYQISGSQLILVTGQGNAVFSYSVKGDELYLGGNGRTLVYTKGGAGVAASNAAAGGAGKGQVAAELAGKWCYINVSSSSSGGASSERCITLHPNGTYEYYGESSRSVNTSSFSAATASQSSDQGTWTFDGQQLYYTSSAGVGSGSYQLQKVNHPKNGDPMIVLNGESYVTFYQKDPWR